MKFRNIFWGIILILIGILFTLDNLNVLDFDWYNLWRLWPVVFILWGISVLPVKDIIKVVLVIVVLGGSVTYMMNNTVDWKDHTINLNYHFDDMDEDFTSIDQEFTIPMEDSILFAKLDMEVAASKFTLVDESLDLVDFQKSGSMLNYKYSVKQSGETVDVDIYINEDLEIRTKPKNKVELAISPLPVWDMYYEVGAADVDMDLTSFKVNELHIEGGAAAIRVKIGDKFDNTRLSIESGASSIKVSVPEESGCELNISAVLSGKSIVGFEKIDHGHYRTENFETAENKIYIDVEAAVSSYSIVRY